MRISKVEIDNYKSIKHQVFSPLHGLNAFIGGNSTGKSNIFDAINWLLGPSYPSFNSVKKEDHFLGKYENSIRVALEFDDQHTLEMNESRVDSRTGEVKQGLFYDRQDWNCKGEIRNSYCSAYLGVDRKIVDYLPSNRWSLVGRILLDINKRFLEEEYCYKGETKKKTEWLKQWLTHIRDRLLFSVKDDNGQEIMKQFLTILSEESARQLNRPVSDLVVDLSMYDPWNFYRTLQLIVKEQDMDLEFQASELGMGVQASISIAILKAYSEMNLSKSSPIFIDEPELFLHPHAQRNFYQILRDLSTDKLNGNGELVRPGTQVFYTTHSPNFLSAGHFDEVFVVRKSRDRGTYIKHPEPHRFVVDLKRRRDIETTAEDLLIHFYNAYENTGDSQKANEAFFAKKILLVEGQSEALVLPLLFEQLGFDYIRRGLSIVRCGGKTEIDRFYRLYTECGIACFVIFDGDKQLIGTKEESENISRNKALLTLLGEPTREYPDGIVHEQYLGFETEFANALGMDASLEGLRLFLEVKRLLGTKQITIPDWVADLKESVETLTEEVEASVLLP